MKASAEERTVSLYTTNCPSNLSEQEKTNGYFSFFIFTMLLHYYHIQLL